MVTSMRASTRINRQKHTVKSKMGRRLQTETVCQLILNTDKATKNTHSRSTGIRIHLIWIKRP